MAGSYIREGSVVILINKQSNKQRNKQVDVVTQNSVRPYDEAEVVGSSFPPLGECVAAALFLRLFLKSADLSFFRGPILNFK